MKYILQIDVLLFNNIPSYSSIIILLEKEFCCEGMYRNIVNCIKFNLNHLVTFYLYIDPRKIIKE